MKIKLVNDRSHPLTVSDMHVGEVFSVVGKKGAFMRIDPNFNYFTIKGKLTEIDDPVWVIILGNTSNHHTLGYLSKDCYVSTVYGILNVDLS